MPTFQSIDFSRAVAKRLVAVSDHNYNKRNKYNNHGINNNDDTTPSYMPIATPHALISRHPHALRLGDKDGTLSSESRAKETNPLEVQGISDLRRETANKMVAQSSAGQRHSLMEAVLQEQQIKQQQQQRIQLFSDDNSFDAEVAAKDVLSNIPGTVTVLDLLQYQTAISTTMAQAEEVTAKLHACISTGSLALDTLLGIPSEIATSIASSLHSNSNNSIYNVHASYHHGSLCLPTPVRGLPWGYVIQCTGSTASGKTQLALSVAASATAQDCPVFYVASAFGHGKLKSLASRCKELATALSRDKRHLQAMMNLISFQVLEDGHQLLMCLAELEQQFLAQKTEESPLSPPPYRVVIIDSASGCLSSEDEVLLQRVALRLKHLARLYNLIVWINNASFAPSTYNNNNNNNNNGSSTGYTRSNNNKTLSEFFGKRKPALGMAWNKRVADVHISLEKLPSTLVTGDNNVPNKSTRLSQHPDMIVRATLEAHPFKKCDHNQINDSADFAVSGRFIQDYQSISNADNTLLVVD